MSYLNHREQANARNFARAQEAWDRMTPPEYDDEAREEAAAEAAETELLANGGVIAEALADAVNIVGADYETTPVDALCKPEFCADGKSVAVLLAVMASGDPESARRALMEWRMRLPVLLKRAIDERAGELLAAEPEYEEC